MFDYSMLLIFWNSLLALAFFIFFFYKYKFTKWNDKEIPTITPRIPFGNMQNPLTRKTTTYEHLKEIYDEVKAKKEKHCGLFSYFNPVYLPVDLDIIKSVMTSDFQHFVDRGVYFNEKQDPLSAHLVNIEGQKWKRLRAKLTPTFTSGKMKNMFGTLLKSGEQMLRAMGDFDLDNLDIKEILGCYTTDVIGNCAFGLELNSFIPGKNEFRDYGKKVMEPSFLNVLRIIFCMTFQGFSRKIGMKFFDADVTNFFMGVVKNTIEYREKNGIKRNDFLQLLIDLKNEENEENRLSLEEISAQCFVFFLAGFETSSTAMTFCLYELSRNEDIQEKLREEIVKITKKHDDKLTYDGLGEMIYFQQVLNETLRIYPSVPFIARKCTADYKLPISGKIMEKGTRVFIPIYAIHKDEEIYENPDLFDPDRFSEENKNGRHPLAFMPFGEGPRNCIGSRFGLMQSKVGVALLLKSYKFKLNPKTEKVTFDPNGILLSTKDTIWLSAEKIQ